MLSNLYILKNATRLNASITRLPLRSSKGPNILQRGYGVNRKSVNTLDHTSTLFMKNTYNFQSSLRSFSGIIRRSQTLDLHSLS